MQALRAGSIKGKGQPGKTRSGASTSNHVKHHVTWRHFALELQILGRSVRPSINVGAISQVTLMSSLLPCHPLITCRRHFRGFEVRVSKFNDMAKISQRRETS